MKYRRYKIIHFFETEDKQFGRAWIVQTKAVDMHSDCDARFRFSDLYSQAEFIEYFIVPYDNEIMDELEGIAQCSELWSPDTDDWTVGKESGFVDGIPVIAHHYCGKKQEKAIKSVEGNFHIVSWMPLCQLVIVENAPMHQMSDTKSGVDFFVCGTVRGNISPNAKRVLRYENASNSDFKVAWASVCGSKAEPWLLVASNPQTKIINVPEQMMADNLLEIGQWRQAFPWVTKMMEQSLAKMHEHIIGTYDMYEKHKDDDPNVNDMAGIWSDSFLNANCVYFLPAIKNMLRLFDMAINDIDTWHAAMNYEDELNDIKQIIDKMVSDAELP